jgi:hypothetical protein
MATNISHVEKAVHELVGRIDSVIEAIENKENEGESDSDRIDALTNFKENVESEFEDLLGTLEGLK